MFRRFCVISAAIVASAALFSGCSATQVDTVTVSPTAQTIAVGQTAQFTATGTIGHGKHPSTTSDVTATVAWSSSAPAVASISASGMVTAVSAGTTTISASMKGFTGIIGATAVVTVTGTGGGSTSSDVVSLSIIPGTQSVASPQQTSQFIAIGTTSSGATENLTNQVSWTSSSAQIATISGSAGLATAIGKGTASITALYTNVSNGSAVTATATFTVIGGDSQQFTALTVVPGDQAVSASGQSGQFIALATTGSGTQQDVTTSKQIKWSSSVPTIATVSSSGLATGTSVGTATITAELTNTDGSLVSATAAVTVTSTPAPDPLLSLAIIPNNLSVGDLQDTGQFLAIGTFSTAPYARDVTNSPNTTWISSFPDVFPVNTNSGGTSSASAGIVTAYGSGSATIIAEYTDPTSKTIQTATATFNCPLVLPDSTVHPPIPGSCWTGQTGPLKATLTVYAEGLNTTNWLITAPSATGTPDVIHCGPGWTTGDGSVCTGIYPVGTTVTLTAPAQTGVAFGGWTNNCSSTTPVTAAGPNTCTVVLTSINGGSVNATVGAIFNNQ